MLKKRILFLILSILISYLSSFFLMRYVFIVDSPKIRPNLSTYLAGKFFLKKDIKIGQKNSYTNINKVNLVFSQLKQQNFISIEKGVYAVDLGNGAQYILIKQNEVEWLEYTFNIKGKEIKIKVPKGEQPPSKGVIEAFYK